MSSGAFQIALRSVGFPAQRRPASWDWKSDHRDDKKTERCEDILRAFRVPVQCFTSHSQVGPWDKDKQKSWVKQQGSSSVKYIFCAQQLSKSNLSAFPWYRGLAQSSLGAADVLIDLVLMLRPVLENLVQSGPGPSQVQLQRVQDGLLVLFQSAPHALEALSDPLLHHLRAPLQGGTEVPQRSYFSVCHQVICSHLCRCLKLTERSALRFFRDSMWASVLDLSACSSSIRLDSCSCRVQRYNAVTLK